MSKTLKAISAKVKANTYGYCYDKSGKLKNVSAPVTGNGVAKKHKKTLTGKIPDSVGFSGFRN